MSKQVEVIEVRVLNWSRSADYFLHRLDTVGKRAQQPVATIAIRESDRSPAGSALAFMDPSMFAQVVLQVNPLNAEQVHELMRRDGGRLASIEPVPGGPKDQHGVPIVRKRGRSHARK